MSARLTEGAAFMLTMVIAVATFDLLPSRIGDDAYITYRIARNLAGGLGFAYNGGEDVLSTTAPLFAVLLGALARLGAEIPSVSAAVSAGAIAVGAWAMWRLGRLAGEPVAGALGIALFPTNYVIFSAFGMEILAVVALVLLAMVAYGSDRPLLAAGLVAVATAIRGDALAAAVAMAAVHVARHRAIPMREGLTYGAVLAPWLLVLAITTGSPIPDTLSAKQHQAGVGGATSFVEKSAETARLYASRGDMIPHFAFAAVGVISVGGGLTARGRRVTSPAPATCTVLVVWAALHGLLYTALGVATYPWYAVPIAVAAIALTAHGVHVATARVGDKYGSRTGALVACAAAALLVAPQMRSLRDAAAMPDSRRDVYREVGEWLQTSTPADTTVGALEVGIIGYYADRHFVDFAGLLQPAMAREVGRRGSFESTAGWAIATYRPEYLVLAPFFAEQIAPDLARAGCRSVREFRDDPAGMVLYVWRCGYHVVTSIGTGVAVEE